VTSLVDLVGPVDELGCRPWLGRVRRDGAAVFHAGASAARLVWEAEVGPVPDGYRVARSPCCASKRCVASEHHRLERWPAGSHAGRAGYACRCGDCRSARRRADRAAYRAAALEAGRVVRRRVDSSEAAAHVAWLLASGMTRGTIAEAAGVDRHTVGRVTTAGRVRVDERTARRLLAVVPP
jgi:hypothetical protein